MNTKPESVEDLDRCAAYISTELRPFFNDTYRTTDENTKYVRQHIDLLSKMLMVSSKYRDDVLVDVATKTQKLVRLRLLATTMEQQGFTGVHLIRSNNGLTEHMSGYITRYKKISGVKNIPLSQEPYDQISNTVVSWIIECMIYEISPTEERPTSGERSAKRPKNTMGGGKVFVGPRGGKYMVVAGVKRYV